MLVTDNLFLKYLKNNNINNRFTKHFITLIYPWTNIHVESYQSSKYPTVSELLSNISTEKRKIQPSYNNQSQKNLQHSNKMKLTRTQYLLITIPFSASIALYKKMLLKVHKKIQLYLLSNTDTDNVINKY